MKKTRLTVAQATIAFLKNQFVRQDELEIPFFAGCFGIFGHGNVAGLGEALKQNPDFTYYQARNEQAMVHTAAAYAKMKNRLQTFVCTTSIGPGSTNMVTAAAELPSIGYQCCYYQGTSFNSVCQSPTPAIGTPSVSRYFC